MKISTITSYLKVPGVGVGVCVAILCCLLPAGCGEGEKPKFRIGVAQCSGDYWREKTNRDLRLELLNHPDTELEILNADNSSEQQARDVRRFIDEGMDLIILAPNEAEPLVGVVNEALDKGIPVVTFDRMLASDRFTAHVEVDNRAIGRGAARYAKSLGKKPLKIIEVRGPSSASPAQLRHEGFAAEVDADPDMEIVASVFGNWDDGLTAHLTDSLLDIYPDVGLIYAHTDHMALGASRVLKERGRGDVDVIGIDGFPHIGIKAVSDGDMTATFLYPTEGHRLLRTAVDILHGRPYERITRVAPLSPIDASNADILLAQDTLLNEENAKIMLLNEKVDRQLERYTSQKALLLLVLAGVVLLIGFVFLLLRSINLNRRNQAELLLKNRQLADEKEKQEQLYDRLSEATRSKLTFFTNVSHDLRTPLTLIAGPVEQVAQAPELSEQNRSLMKLTRKNVHILRRLIDQILDFNKFEDGMAALRLSEVDFPALLRDWAEAFAEVAAKRHIKLKVEMPEQSFRCAIDAEKMERVFFNLMSNAFKHTPDNGRISVHWQSAGDTAGYAVSDTGSGISPEEVNRIFDRFYQAEGANPKGSGIGLALTKAFVELHGGSISVESEKGKGSEFKVMVPVRHVAADSVEVEPRITAEDVQTELAGVEEVPVTPDNEKPTLLVVDDNKDIRTLISTRMGADYNILTAADGLQGLRMAARYVPDLILCDVMMPVMDGMECVRRLKEEVSTSHIPVLMLTACSLDEQRLEGYNNGADAYLAKPFNLDLLEARCRNLLASRKLIKQLYLNAAPVSTDVKESKKARRPSHRPNDVENEFYARFAEIVEKKMADPNLQVADIAAELGLSQSQFSRKIKALTNYTPVEIIRRMRLEKAKTMLVATDAGIGEIAFAVGFSSLAYFSKCYREAFGSSPSDARQA